MTLTADNLALNITQEVHVKASIETTFEALLDQMGPYNERGDGSPMPMKLELRPGGRWYRDLGSDNGHFWGHVQAVIRPTLIEICGPLFASYPCVSNVQYRLSEEGGGTLISFKHTAMGFVSDEHRRGVNNGWATLLERIRKQAEG